MAGGDDPDLSGAESVAQKLAAIPPMTDVERACNLGDLLEVIAPLDLLGTMDDPTPSVVQASGQIYKASGLIDRGWDLTRISGDGPDEIRILNSYVKDYFRVLPKEPAAPEPV